jgi:small subunit ribosomal protein S17e
MGRIKTQLIKRISHKLLEKYSSELTDNFSKNKELVAKFADVPSKKLLNIVSGYVTRLVKMQKKTI